jgi:hypothetical protein
LGVSVPVPAPPFTANAEDYVGLYPLSPLFAIRVAQQNGALYFQPGRQPGAGLKSLGQDRFVLAGPPEQIYFLRDDSGNVAALLWRQNGQKYLGFRDELPE